MAVAQTPVAAALIADFLQKFAAVIAQRGQGVVADELDVDRRSLGAYYREENPAEPTFDLIVAAMEQYGIVLDSGGFVFGSRTQVTPRFEPTTE